MKITPERIPERKIEHFVGFYGKQLEIAGEMENLGITCTLQRPGCDMSRPGVYIRLGGWSQIKWLHAQLTELLKEAPHES